MFMPKIPIN